MAAILVMAGTSLLLAQGAPAGISGSGGGGGSGGFSSNVVGVAGENTLIIRESPDNLARIEAILRSLDQAPKQVLIEAHIFDVALDDTNSTGLDWSAIMTQLGRQNPLFQFDQTMLGSTGGNGTLRFGTLNNEHFTLLLKGLKKNNRARSLSNPKVTAISGQKANIQVGQKIPYVTTNTTTTNGTVYTDRVVRFEEVPIDLSVVPTIYDDGTIRLSVQPTITALVSFVEGVPWTEKRTSNTDIIVRTGETLILGGLITERRSTDKNSVPLFDKIPLTRKLFSRTEKTAKRSELVVFITPNLIDSAPVRPAPPLLSQSVPSEVNQ